MIAIHSARLTVYKDTLSNQEITVAEEAFSSDGVKVIFETLFNRLICFRVRLIASKPGYLFRPQNQSPHAL